MNILNTTKTVALCGSLLLLMGCPYSSVIPLSSADTAAPNYLIGQWDDGTGGMVEIARTEGNTLSITKFTETEDSEPSEPERYTGFITIVNGVTFLNLNDFSWNDDGDYYFYKIEKVDDNNITVFEVTENIRETFEDSKSLSNFFSKNMTNSYFYSSGEISYSKVK